MYRLLFNLFFKPLDPELSHQIGEKVLKLAFKLRIIRPRPANSKVSVMGLEFDNRLGLAAGFDKNAKLVRPMHALGFGHVELGTVTPLPQPGNPKPRSFRVPEHNALINRMGFNNDGAAVIADRVLKLRAENVPLPVIGINVGKNKWVEASAAADDYRTCTRLVAQAADYLAVNVSSPNTPGLRDLQQVETLRPILEAVIEESLGKPVLLKLAPDLADEDFIAALNLVRDLKLAGVILANTTIRRDGVGNSEVLKEVGGLSGPVLASRAKEMLVAARGQLGPGFTIISVGGVSTPQDAKERIELGADLVQVYTGFIYGGPLWPARLARSLV